MIRTLILLGIFWIGYFTLDPPQIVQADSTNNRVMLVYDSENEVKDNKKNIDTLQRTLTSINLRVKTIEQSHYKSGALNQSYIGVITMINWRQVGLINQNFIHDRDRFNGIKLHIGENLTQKEIDQLGVKVKKVYQQQFLLNNDQEEQLLPFSQSITVIDSAVKQDNQIGTLMTQESNQKTYPFGYINGKNAYLPFFATDGLSLMTEVQLIAKLFGRLGKFQPLLTITNVTPYSNLRRLDELSKYLYKNDIPFAISTVSVSENTEMKAFSRFAAVLRNVENRGGIIFLQAPKVTSNADSTGEVLENNFLTYIVSLSRHQVFPVGISADGFWNQDKILRANALRFADHWLLLPNETPTYVKQDNDSQVAKQSFFAMKASSLNDVKKDDTTNFVIPTALTVSMPYTQKKLQQVENGIKNLSLTWFDPVNDNLQTEVKTETTILQYQHGNYLVNGENEEVQSSNNVLNKQFSDGKPVSLFSNYFKIQGNILAIFFVIITIILGVFIYFGQKIYWNRFRSK